MSSSEADELAKKLEGYVLNLRKVEAALEQDPTHVELLKLKADLNELIDLTRKLLTDQLLAGATLSRIHEGPTSAASAASSSVSNPIPGPSSSATIKPEVMLKCIKTLEDNVYRDFIIQAFDAERPIDIIQSISKFYGRKGKKVVSRRLKKMNRLNGNKDDNDTDDENNAGEANQSNGMAVSGKRDQEFSKSAWKAPLIYRGDMVVSDDLLFIVINTIRLKPTIFRDHKTVAAIVCVVNLNRFLVLWAKVKWSEDEICQTNPNKTGITADKLENGLPLEQVAALLKVALKGNVLIGFNVQERLSSLEVNHDKIIDLQDYYRNEEGPYRCEDAKYVLDACGGDMGPNKIIHEARALPGLYVWMKTKEQEYPVFTTHPMANIVQSMKREGILKDLHDPSDSCQCSF